jgi:hypothetical protein
MQCEFVELGCFEVKELKTWKEGIIRLQWGEGSISDRTNTFRAQEDFTVNYHTVGTTHIDYSLLNYYCLSSQLSGNDCIKALVSRSWSTYKRLRQPLMQWPQ